MVLITAIRAYLPLIFSATLVVAARPSTHHSRQELKPTDGKGIFINPGPGIPSQESVGLDPATLYDLAANFDIKAHSLTTSPNTSHLTKHFDPLHLKYPLPLGNPAGPINTLTCIL